MHHTKLNLLPPLCVYIDQADQMPRTRPTARMSTGGGDSERRRQQRRQQLPWAEFIEVAEQAHEDRHLQYPTSWPEGWVSQPVEPDMVPAEDAAPSVHLAFALAEPAWQAGHDLEERVTRGRTELARMQRGESQGPHFPPTLPVIEADDFDVDYEGLDKPHLWEALAHAEVGYAHYSHQTLVTRRQLAVALDVIAALQADLQAARAQAPPQPPAPAPAGPQQQQQQQPLQQQQQPQQQPPSAPGAPTAGAGPGPSRGHQPIVYQAPHSASSPSTAPEVTSLLTLVAWAFAVIEKLVHEGARAANEAMLAQRLWHHHTDLCPTCPFPGYRANSTAYVSSNATLTLLHTMAETEEIRQLCTTYFPQRLSAPALPNPGIWNNGKRVGITTITLPTMSEVEECMRQDQDVCPHVSKPDRRHGRTRDTHAHIGRIPTNPAFGYKGPPPGLSQPMAPSVVSFPEGSSASAASGSPSADLPAPQKVTHGSGPGRYVTWAALPPSTAPAASSDRVQQWVAEARDHLPQRPSPPPPLPTRKAAPARQAAESAAQEVASALQAQKTELEATAVAADRLASAARAAAQRRSPKAEYPTELPPPVLAPHPRTLHPAFLRQLQETARASVAKATAQATEVAEAAIQQAIKAAQEDSTLFAVTSHPTEQPPSGGPVVNPPPAPIETPPQRSVSPAKRGRGTQPPTSRPTTTSDALTEL